MTATGSTNAATESNDQPVVFFIAHLVLKAIMQAEIGKCTAQEQPDSSRRK
jgi:hypothetical protein